MQYCQTCLYPETKPDLKFDEKGVCSACTAYNTRRSINWTRRGQEFRDICNELKRGNHTYHCVVPVSGGKDSHYQILKVKEYGLNPLAVCAHTDMLSGIGRRNLDNIARLGVDLIEVHTNRRVRARINSYTLREVGDISWAEHASIFSIPIRIATRFSIPLIVWGENPQNEYGGPTNEAQQAIELDNRWLQEFGGLLGLRVSDLIDAQVASAEDLHLYTWPNFTMDVPLSSSHLPMSPNTPKGIFLGQFFPWDGAQNAIEAAKHGFKVFPHPVEGSGYTYENLDNLMTGIHDYFKYLKYGFGRATDLVCNHIRRGAITRAEGKQIILQHDGSYPSTYLGVSLESILEPLDISVEDFVEIANKFTNPNLFIIQPGRPRPTAKFIGDLKSA